MATKDQDQEPEAAQTGTAGNKSRPPSSKKADGTPSQTDLAPKRNATGPRTQRGKKRASGNATKFGIFSKEILLAGESQVEFESLRHGFWKSKLPEGAFEEVLLDKLLSVLWRQRRVLIAERAEIRRNSEFVELDRRQKNLEELEEVSQKWCGEINRRFASNPVGLFWSIENPEVLARCIEILAELQQGIKARGFDKQLDEYMLKSIYDDPREAHVRLTLQDEYVNSFRTAEATEEERARENYPTPDQCVKNVLRAVGAEIRRLEQYRKEREPIESARAQVEILRQQVPDLPGLDRLLRYANSLEREFDRVLAQFDRAQRIRKEQPLPPQGER
jgi:hypothetical protein